MYGTIGVINLSTDQLALGIQQDMTPVGPQVVFDEAGRLNFRVGNPAAGGTTEASFALHGLRPGRSVLVLHHALCRSDRLRIAQPQGSFWIIDIPSGWTSGAVSDE